MNQQVELSKEGRFLLLVSFNELIMLFDTSEILLPLAFSLFWELSPLLNPFVGGFKSFWIIRAVLEYKNELWTNFRTIRAYIPIIWFSMKINTQYANIIPFTYIVFVGFRLFQKMCLVFIDSWDSWSNKRYIIWQLVQYKMNIMNACRI